jgi:hypothetical protein
MRLGGELLPRNYPAEYAQQVWFVGRPEAPRLLLRTGDPIPGDPSQTFFGVSGGLARFTDEGAVWFENVYVGTAAERHPTQLYDPPGPAPIGVLRAWLPGADGRPTSRPLYNVELQAVAPDGRLVLTGHEDPPPQPPNPYTGGAVLYAGTLDGLRALARFREQAPGLEPGMLMAGPTYASINAGGQAAFVAGVGRAPLDAFTIPDYHFELYAFDGDTLRVLARPGTPAHAPGASFLGATSDPPLVDGAGRVTFTAVYTGPGGTPQVGIFTYQAGVYRLIASTGQQAPDAPPGMLITRLGTPSMNESGQFAFIGALEAPGGVFDSGIFATDATGRLRMVVRGGDTVDVGGRPRTIEWFEAYLATPGAGPYPFSTNGADGERSSFNDHGQLVFRAQFNRNESAVVVADVNAGVTRVAGRHVFYNGSAFDGRDAAANAADDGAIAPDKRAVPAGGLATFSNVTSYARGLNGIMVDIANLPAGGVLSADDFAFRTGRGADASTWVPAAAPAQVVVRRGAGVNGTDRITLVWTNATAVRNGWLEVTVKATPATGLSAADVSVYGNLVGETGDAAALGRALAVTPADYARTAAARTAAASITSAFDFDRDGRVSVTDLTLCRLAFRRSIAVDSALAVAPSATRRSNYAPPRDLL